MPIEVELPDGSIAEFPDGTPPATIESALRRQFPSPRSSPSRADAMLAREAAGSIAAPSILPNVSIPSGVVSGFLKGVPRTVAGLGEMVHKIPGVSGAMDSVLGAPGTSAASFAAAREATAPVGTAEKVGQGIEQAAEFFALPGPAKAQGLARLGQMAKTGVTAAGLATAQGAGPGEAAVMGALAGLPVAPAVESVARKAVRSVLKPTVAAMKRIAGGGVRGIDAQAERLVTFIIDNGLATADEARALLASTERELQRVLSVRNAPTDAPQRALRYLDALARNAKKAGMGSDKVRTLREAASEVLDGIMGRDLAVMTPAGPVTVRVPRADMTAAEALESARASSRWSTRGTWGPKDRAEAVRNVAEKAVEKAQRDAVKAAVPEARTLLSREASALNAEEVLSRAAFREGNNSMTGVAGAVEVGLGRAPLFGWASKLLREGQLRGGVWAGRLAKSLQQRDAQGVVMALQRLGVQVPAELLAGTAQ